MGRRSARNVKEKPLSYADYEVYSKYKRLLRNGESHVGAMEIIAQLNAVDISRIDKIIKQESAKEKILGESAYIAENRGNVSGNRW